MREMPVKRAGEILGKSDSRPNGHPKAIQYVGINMSAAYATGANANFGNARVVYEKFHVIQNAVEAYEEVRKAERRADAGKRARLERTPNVWLKSRVN
jgi:transposase